MERHLWQQCIKAKWHIFGFAALSLWYQKWVVKSYLIDHEVFGFDGNGGTMIKIITDLTDEEMARMKYVRRLYWHWKGSRKRYDGRETISSQELSDRGIEWKEDPYIEYVKRPPHDKYL